MVQQWKALYWHLELVSALCLGGGIAFENSALAQSNIVPDNTLGAGSSIVQPNFGGLPVELITGGTQAGQNLFHSFREFNVSQGRAAFFFSSSSEIQNILARVTGSNPSLILGTLGTLSNAGVNTNPNLFLINPNGIIFGQNASLDMRTAGAIAGTPGGSFIATTADAILLGNTGVFSASKPETSQLLAVNPSAFFFNNLAQPALANRSTATRSVLGRVTDGLQVQNGRSLLLVGGNVNLEGGRLTAPSGRVELGGVTGSGTVGLTVAGNDLQLNFPNDVTRTDIALSKGAIVNTNGDPGGEIQLQGRRITLTDTSFISAETRGSQNGGGISIDASELIVQDGSQISTSTRSQGQGGNLSVTASELVELSGIALNGNPSGLFAQTFAKGNAGSLTIATEQLIVRDGANVTASTLNEGHGGTLSVTASKVELSGVSAVTQRPSALFAQTLDDGDAGNLTINNGDAGNLTINTRQLIVRDGAQVVAGTGDGSQGNGGILTVTASDFVELSGKAPQTNSGLFARTRGSGNAGNLSLTTGQLVVRDGAQVTVSGIASGNAGTLDVTAQSIRLENQGAIVAETASAQGGDITLQVQDVLVMRNNSRISTTAGTAQAGGDGGNVNIDAQFIIAVPSENSDIAANAYEGNGGRVEITAESIIGIEFRSRPTPLSDITASSEFGVSGVVEINQPDVDPSRGLSELPTDLGDRSGLIDRSCSTAGGATARNLNHFFITGRGGLPPSPTESLSSDVVWQDWRIFTSNPEHRTSVSATVPPAFPSKGIVEAQGWVIRPNGQVILTAQVPSVTPHGSLLTSPSCQASGAMR